MGSQIARDLVPRIALLFMVTAERIAHGAEDLVSVLGVAAAIKAAEERGGNDMGWNAFFHCRDRGPAAFAGIADATAKLIKLGIFGECRCGEVKQPT